MVRLGGWGVHIPYAITWAHEAEHGLAEAHPRVCTVGAPAELPEAIALIASGARPG